MDPVYSTIAEQLAQLSLTIHYATPAYLYVLVTGICMGFLLFKQRWYDSIVVATASFTTAATVELIKQSTAVPRPETALVTLSSYAFPSAHAAGSMLLAVLFIWLMQQQQLHQSTVRAAGLILLFTAVCIGSSRVFIDVHTHAQVLAGFLIGGSIPLIIIGASQHLRTKVTRGR